MIDGDEEKIGVVVMMMTGENQELEMNCGEEVVTGMILVAVTGEIEVGLGKRVVAGGIKVLWMTAGVMHGMNEVHQEIRCGCVTENHPHEMMTGKTEE